MKPNIMISVIVTAYNVESWLARCLDSILNQTYKNLEIIVINDGSQDGTGLIIDEFAKRDKRIVKVHQKNKGLVLTREIGIKLALGQYIGFVDGDDSIEPDMYERLLKNAIKYQADISQCGILYCFYNGRTVPMHGTNEVIVFDNDEGVRALLYGNKIEPSLCNKLYSAELLEDSCLDNSILNNEDLLRNFVLFSRAKKSIFEDFCGYFYWRREGSMSNNNAHVQTWKSMLNGRKLIYDLAKDEVRDAACFCYLSALIGAYNASIGLKDREVVLLQRSCKKELKMQHDRLFILNMGRLIRVVAILYLPRLYNMLYKVHIKYIYVKDCIMERKINK